MFRRRGGAIPPLLSVKLWKKRVIPLKNRRVSVRILSAVLIISIIWAAVSVPLPVLAGEASGEAARAYEAYQVRLNQVKKEADITASGFDIIENQVFTMTVKAFGDVSMIPAIDRTYRRLVLFFVEEGGIVVYKTDQLETNNQVRGELGQSNQGIAAVSFQDLDGDDLMDIILITSCKKEDSSSGIAYKVGDVLFQNKTGFYRDWRLSEKINRFGMNKSIRFIASFLEEGYSTEFLYTASTLEELEAQGFLADTELSGYRQFEKLGKLLVVPGTYRMAEYTVFMVYLVNEQGYIVWSFQPMGEYESLYALKGVACKDIDGDGMKDLIILARYSYEGKEGETVLENDYSIYYQRTGGFYRETEFKKQYRSEDDGTMEKLIQEARAYWGWRQES